MSLFTPDTKVQVYMDDKLVFDISGVEQLEETFSADSSIRHKDEYVQRDGRWLIKTRISHFTITDLECVVSWGLTGGDPCGMPCV
jgi:hypothetical protein